MYYNGSKGRGGKEGEQMENVYALLPGDIPLAMWAEREGLTDSYVRSKARRGMIKTAHKVGRDWFINESEHNIDNRFKP